MPNIPRAGALSSRPGVHRQEDMPAGPFRDAFAGIHASAAYLGPYYSPKRDPVLCLNGKARVGDTLLFCRQLSVLWERSFDGNAGKPDYRHLSSVGALQAHAPHDIEAHAGRRQRAEATFVDNADWGCWLADAFKAMDATGRGHRALHVQTTNHAMALGLRLKGERGDRSYVVKFYDPNRTATHLRIRGADPDAFAGLSARDFLPAPGELADYGMHADRGAVVFLGDVIPDHGRQAVRIGHVDSATLLHLMHLGLPQGIVRFGEMVQARTLDAHESAGLLGAKTKDGMPGLSMAMQRDDGASIRAYGDILVRARLDSPVASELLACRTDNGVPGLHVAMQDDLATAVLAWGEVFLRCGLGVEDAAALLAAKRPDGTSGLNIAMWWDNAAAIRAYGNILLASRLPGAKLVELMEAKDSDGTPALYSAMGQDSARAIGAFGDILMASALDASERLALLAAVDAAGESGLTHAIRTNRVEAIRAYGNVLQTSGLDRSQLDHLLGATGSIAPAQSQALRDARPTTRWAYSNLLGTPAR